MKLKSSVLIGMFTLLSFSGTGEVLAQTNAPLSQDILYAPAPIDGPSDDIVFYSVDAFSQYTGGSRWEQGTTNSTKRVYFGDNGEVYIGGILYNVPNGEYIKGYIEGDKIVFDFPQYYKDRIYWNDEGEKVVQRLCIRCLDSKEWVSTENGETITTYEYSISNTQKVEFSYNPETGKMVQLTDVALGLCTEDLVDGEYEFRGSCDKNLVFDRVNTIFFEVPENIEYVDYIVRGKSQYNDLIPFFVKIAFENDFAFLKGLCYADPEMILRLEKNEKGNYILPTLEYLGVYNDYDIFSYTFEMDASHKYYTCLDSVEFSFNENTREMSMLNWIGFNYGVGNLSYLEIFGELSFEPGEIPAVAKPAHVTNFRFEDLYDNYGVSYYYFNALNLSETGQVLPSDRLFYQILLDGEPYVFTVAQYDSIEEDTTRIPLEFADEWDFNYQGGNGDYDGALRSPVSQTIGIQLLYRNDDGTYTGSDIVSLNVETGEEDIYTGIESINKTTDYETVYDLMGRKVNNPERGIYVINGKKIFMK